jgi:signal transduction histidine kinase
LIADDAQVRQILDEASPKRSAVAQRFVSIAIPLLTLWIAAAMIWYHHEIDEKKKVVVRIELERIDTLAGRMAHEIDSMAFRLLLFSTNTELQQMLADADGVISHPAVEQEFLAFMRLSKLLSQGRVLDAHGMELLRINHDRNRPYFLPVEELQPKDQAPYFRRTAALPAGKVDVSPINLNVERGKTEQSARLILRLSTPIRTDDGSLLGVLVFDYRAKQLLALMSENDLLLGTGPFWLRAPRSATETGLVAGEVRRALSMQLADSLNHISREKNGWFPVSDDDGLLVFTSLDKRPEASHIQWPKTHTHDRYNWRLLSLLSKDTHPVLTMAFFLPLLVSFSILLILASWLWARVGLQRELAVRHSSQLAYENRRLAQRLFAVQEEERRLLAQELHDEMGQSLTAIRTNAVLILRNCSRGEEMKVAESAEDIRSVSAHLFHVVRQRLRQLRPPLLDHAGLNICLKESITSWQQRTGIDCKLRIEGNMDDLNSEVSIGIYRIIQEALTNVSSHAQASSVYIRLRRLVPTSPEEQDVINLEIRDNGIGMHEDEVSSGLGLVGMRERARALGGSFSISASPGNGIAIVVHIPLPEQGNEVDR